MKISEVRKRKMACHSEKKSYMPLLGLLLTEKCTLVFLFQQLRKKPAMIYTYLGVPITKKKSFPKKRLPHIFMSIVVLTTMCPALACPEHIYSYLLITIKKSNS